MMSMFVIQRKDYKYIYHIQNFLFCMSQEISRINISLSFLQFITLLPLSEIEYQDIIGQKNFIKCQVITVLRTTRKTNAYDIDKALMVNIEIGTKRKFKIKNYCLFVLNFLLSRGTQNFFHLLQALGIHHLNKTQKNPFSNWEDRH